MDWRTYPIATIEDTPEKIDPGVNQPGRIFRLAAPVNRPLLTLRRPWPTRSLTLLGVRLRRVPFTAERVKTALDCIRLKWGRIYEEPHEIYCSADWVGWLHHFANGSDRPGTWWMSTSCSLGLTLTTIHP